MKTKQRIRQCAIPQEIANLNLELIRAKIIAEDRQAAREHGGAQLWTIERSHQAVADYRRFLALMLWYPKLSIVPSSDVDSVWHGHILCTRQYATDCKNIFGRYRHHFPTFGESDEVMEKHVESHEMTTKLFEEHFGTVPESYKAGVFLGSAGGCYGCNCGPGK